MRNKKEIPAHYRGKVEAILEAVCTYFGVSRDDLDGGSRRRREAEPRMVAMYLIHRCVPRLTYDQVGVAVKKNHATASHAYHSIDVLTKIDPQIRRWAKDLLTNLRKELMPAVENPSLVLKKFLDGSKEGERRVFLDAASLEEVNGICEDLYMTRLSDAVLVHYGTQGDWTKALLIPESNFEGVGNGYCQADEALDWFLKG